jgi:hypothetical protein
MRRNSIPSPGGPGEGQMHVTPAMRLRFLST